ncbi:sensor histidine kinase [Prosthecobacter sp.]|uniref:sensor histidine kinase n=1 Tax=Prosthecobacter sp. TaxID=1965333 RepID=UPI00378437A9
MPRLKLPLYLKILLWFLLNVAVLAALGFGFMRAQFKLGLDWMLAGEPGDRIAALGDSVSQEFSRLPESRWNERLQAYDSAHGVTLALFDNHGTQAFGTPVSPPPEVLRKLMDRRPPGEERPRRQPGPVMKRPADAPPKPRFMLRGGEPARYWAGIHLDLLRQDNGTPLVLLMASDSLSGGGLLFDLWPWLAFLAVALLVSALMWMPFVSSITRFIRSLNHAAGRIARGKFGERVKSGRSDELGQLSDSVNAMAAQLGDYVAQQRRITADVAHELCSPIARMQMALGVVEQRASPEQTTYLQKLDNELQHMARLVEEVLAFSKAETLPEREAPETVDLAALLRQVITREAPDAPVRLDIPPTLPPLHTLRGALDRAVGNVLRNAVRYAGGSEIEIHAATSPDGMLTLQVLDRGPGVPAEALSRLFEPFFRPEVARSRSTGGSGLGLAITQRCLQACGGDVRALNREGGGLEVEMRLPMKLRASA